MRDEDERLFFEHDVATPFTNLRGAHYLLKLYLREPAPEVAESLGILEANIRTLERMVGWYWRVRQASETLTPVEAWPLSDLVPRLGGRIRQEKLPLQPPGGDPGNGRTRVDADALETGLLGAALTLCAAAETAPAWAFEAGDAFCHVVYTLPGDSDLLDAERLFRKVCWPGGPPVAAWVDAGLPFLEAVLRPLGGNLELVHRDEVWSLRASVPLVP